MAGYRAFEDVRRIAVLGTGTIGASWAAYFLARGYDVAAWDPSGGFGDALAAFVDNARPQLQAVGTAGAAEGRLILADGPEAAVDGADFVQENAPERAPIKRDLYDRIDAVLGREAILATSTSGLILSDLVSDLSSAERFVVGHPFNPPHLIPLVEVVLSNRSDPAAGDWAHGFYRHIGKHPIRVNKEVPGHLSNRLQAALWREAFSALENDLASVEDINAAIAQGPGLRYSLMGPHMIFNLTGGKGGIRASLAQFGPPMQGWWKTMTTDPALDDPAFQEKLVAGIEAEMGERSIEDLERERDVRLVALLKMLRETEAG